MPPAQTQRPADAQPTVGIEAASRPRGREARRGRSAADGGRPARTADVLGGGAPTAADARRPGPQPEHRRAAGGVTSSAEPTRTAVQAEYDGPPIPDDITGAELDR